MLASALVPKGQDHGGPLLEKVLWQSATNRAVPAALTAEIRNQPRAGNTSPPSAVQPDDVPTAPAPPGQAMRPSDAAATDCPPQPGLPETSRPVLLVAAGVVILGLAWLSQRATARRRVGRRAGT